jgi:hypothetical protein
MFSHSLCFTCMHRRVIRSKRGSEFWLCDRNRQDERYPKYPPQPVGQCTGYEREKEEGDGA